MTYQPASLTVPTITIPFNEEAEQGLLAAILLNNKAYERVSGFLRPEHFYDPVHQRIYEACQRLIEEGKQANPVTLKHQFDNDHGLSLDGGAGYLAELAANVVTVINAADYGRTIHDLFLRRQLIEVGTDMIASAAVPDQDATATGLISAAEEQLFALGEKGATDRAVLTGGQATELAMQANEVAWKNGGKLMGVTSGLADLDRAIGGFRPGLYVLGARPSMGKSALAFNTFMLAAAASGVPVLGFSTEMSAESVARRHLAARTGVSYDKQIHGDMTGDEWLALCEAQQHIAALPIAVDDTPGVTVAHIRRIARQHKRRHGLGMIVIDHLHRMRASKRAEDQGETAKITEITSALCAIWKEFNVPVLLLCQLNRDLERRDDKHPNMADLRQSGSIEQDADVVMFLYRESYYLSREEPVKKAGEDAAKYNDRHEEWCMRCREAEGIAEIIVEKNREGNIGTTIVHFDGPRTMFTNLYRGA